MMRLLSRFFLIFLGLSPIAVYGEGVQLQGLSCRQQDSAENLIKTLTSLPTLPFVPADQGAKRVGFVSSASIFSAVIGTDPRSIILNQVEELRFLPQTLAHSSVLLVLDGAEGWSEDKERKVRSVAEMLEIKISLVWLSDAEVPLSLRRLADASQGKTFKRSELVRRAMDYACGSTPKPEDRPASEPQNGVATAEPFQDIRG